MLGAKILGAEVRPREVGVVVHGPVELVEYGDGLSRMRQLAAKVAHGEGVREVQRYGTHSGGAVECRACNEEIAAALKRGSDDNGIVDHQLSDFSVVGFLDVQDDTAVTFWVG